MQSTRDFAIRCYTRLLRLYPAAFRAEFGDEMEGVFAQAVNEAADGLALLGVVAGEARDLPASVIRAHVAERRRTAVGMEGATIVIGSPDARRAYRWPVWGSLAVFAAYTLLVVAPFFALGLHQQPADLVRGGAFDPKGYSVYGIEGTYPNLLLIVTFLTMLTGPVWATIGGGTLLLVLWKHGRHYGRKRRLLAGLALVASASVVAFLFSPLGRLILAWWLD